MGSTRLPGKVLREIDGLLLIDRVVKQVTETKYGSVICVATTTRGEDDVLYQHCRNSLNLLTYRGDSKDVLKRYWDCYSKIKLNECDSDLIVRVTADDPFKCPELIHACVDAMLEDDSLDYVSNITDNGYPEGLDVEVIRASALEKTCRQANSANDREHVTQYIIKNPNIFKLGSIVAPHDYSRFRLTVDHESDIEVADFLARSIPKVFSWQNIRECLETNEAFFMRTNNLHYGNLKNKRDNRYE